MKTKKRYLTLAVITAILSIPALGDIQLIQRDEPRVNPALAGIEELYVFIVQPDAEPNKDGLVWEELDGKVGLKLKETGIKIAPIAYLDRRVVMDHNIPQLRVYIDMLKLSDLQQYVFHVQTSLAKKIYLTKDSSQCIKADAWKAGPAMQAVSVQSMPAAVTSAVLEQVEAFIHAYLAANPPNKRPTDANDISIAPKEHLKPVAKLTPAEYKYVASKNSKVFHKPDCIWAKRIKPENLIGYSSRDEAINTGKRPCRQCKP